MWMMQVIVLRIPPSGTEIGDDAGSRQTFRIGSESERMVLVAGFNLQNIRLEMLSPSITLPAALTPGSGIKAINILLRQYVVNFLMYQWFRVDGSSQDSGTKNNCAVNGSDSYADASGLKDSSQLNIQRRLPGFLLGGTGRPPCIVAIRAASLRIEG